MQKLNKILIATDFSDICENAFKHAVGLARRHDAELHLLHVRILHTDILSPMAYGDDEDYTGLAEEKLEEFATKLQQKPFIAVRRDVQAAPAILDYAREAGIDLVVMGTHARSNVSRLFMGSVAAEVLRISEFPVMVVGAEHEAPENGYRDLVLPIDLSEEADILKERATALAEGDKPRFHCVHIFETDHLRHVYSDLRADGQDLVTQEMDRLVQQADLPGEIRQKVLTGASDEQIAEHARDEDADLIVMGRASISRMGRLLVGSTTDRVIRQATCPVLAWRDRRDVAE